MTAARKLVIIISTSEADKARAGMMYAVNALRQGWMEDVRLFFFGPSEQLILHNAELQGLLSEFHETGRTAVACRFIAEEEEYDSELTGIGFDVDFVGHRISELISEGYIPMVW